jgi:hypothetical protein
MEIKGQYLTYQEYKGLGGSLELTPFNLLEFRARKEIDDCTYGRLKKLNTQVNEVKLCIMDLMDKIKKYNEVDNGKSSESVGSYSVTYNKPVDKEERQSRRNIINIYLSECKLSDGTPYLYKG